MAASFYPAFITVVPLTSNTISQSNLSFRQRLTADEPISKYFNANRWQTKAKHDDFWSVYVVGMYELHDNFENVDNDDNSTPDLNSEFGLMGWTENGVSEIANEVVRDVAAQHGWNESQISTFLGTLVIHEVGHQFGLTHSGVITDENNRNVMSAPDGDVQEPDVLGLPRTFTAADIRDIRLRGPRP